jgi:hypothetical protein
MQRHYGVRHPAFFDNLPELTMSKTPNPRDQQTPNTGKVANDHNKVGEQALTQKNEAKRTSGSRTDREAHLGSSNQTQSRRGNTGR